jgi:hypothetical protein
MTKFNHSHIYLLLRLLPLKVNNQLLQQRLDNTNKEWEKLSTLEGRENTEALIYSERIAAEPNRWLPNYYVSVCKYYYSFWY